MNRCVYYRGDPPTGCDARRSIIYPPEATPPKPGYSNGVLHVSPAPPHRSRSERWDGRGWGGPPYSKIGGVSA